MRYPLRDGLALLLCGWATIPCLGQEHIVSAVTTRSWTSMVAGDTLGAEPPVRKVAILPGRAHPAGINIPFAVIPPMARLTTPGGASGVTPVQSTPSPAADFDALLDNNHIIPPDTYGSVGPDHVMTMLNSEVQVQDKGGVILSKVSLASFWSSGVGSANLTDPHVLYDALSGRWFASITVDPDTSTSRIGVAISADANPLGTWRFLTYASPDTTMFPDYPTLGFNNLWIVVTANMFSTSGHGGSSQGPAMWAIDKDAAMQGSGAVSAARFDPGYDSPNKGFTEQPMICYSPCDTLWIVESGKYVANPGSYPLIRISRLTGPVGAPSWSPIPGSPFTGSGFFYVTNDFQSPPSGATQLNSSHTIDNGDARASSAEYRNGHVWFVNSGGLPFSGTPNRTATFWYELDPRSSSPIVQSGVVDPGANSHLLYPSISVNKLNSACIGFTRTDASRYAEAAYTVRQFSDPQGTTQSIAVLKGGLGVYYKTFGGGRNRWGDFSNTVVDPSDSLTFWTIQEYAGTPVGDVTKDGSGRWATHWGKIIVDNPLAVRLVDFTGTMSIDGAVHLAWTTASEVDCYGFRVERSTVGSDNYVPIANSFVPGHGTTIEAHMYTLDDTPAIAGSCSYRLTEIDLDGSLQSFEPIVVTGVASVTNEALPTQASLLQNYPNPFNPKTVISVQWTGDGWVRLAVFDQLGREVAILANGRYPAGRYAFTFDGTNLATGVYFCRLTAGVHSVVRKMLLVR